MNEKLKHIQAFDFYYQLGNKRKISAVASEFDVSPYTVFRWSKNLRWQERVLQRDKEIGSEMMRQTDNEIIKQTQQYRVVVRQNIGVISQLLRKVLKVDPSSGKISDIKLDILSTMDYERMLIALDRLIKSDMILMGQATEIKEQKIELSWSDMLLAMQRNRDKNKEK